MASNSKSSPNKPKSTSKSKRYCKFLKQWTADFAYIQPSKKGELYAFCTYCKSNISVTGGGVNDITRHAEGKKHKQVAKSIQMSSRITKYVSTEDKDLDKVSKFKPHCIVFILFQ